MAAINKQNRLNLVISSCCSFQVTDNGDTIELLNHVLPLYNVLGLQRGYISFFSKETYEKRVSEMRLLKVLDLRVKKYKLQHN